jgi:hypothetical protein
VLITASTTITGIVFYCIICFRKINHLVVKNHLHSSSGVREVVSSTTILQFSREYPQVFLKVHKRQQMKNKIYNKNKTTTHTNKIQQSSLPKSFKSNITAS